MIRLDMTPQEVMDALEAGHRRVAYAVQAQQEGYGREWEGHADTIREARLDWELIQAQATVWAAALGRLPDPDKVIPEVPHWWPESVRRHVAELREAFQAPRLYPSAQEFQRMTTTPTAPQGSAGQPAGAEPDPEPAGAREAAQYWAAWPEGALLALTVINAEPERTVVQRFHEPTAYAASHEIHGRMLHTLNSLGMLALRVAPGEGHKYTITPAGQEALGNARAAGFAP